MRSFRPIFFLLLRLLLFCLLDAGTFGTLQWLLSLCACLLVLPLRLSGSHQSLMSRYFLLRCALTVLIGLCVLFRGSGVFPFGIVFGLVLPTLEAIDSSERCPLLGWTLSGLCCWLLVSSLEKLGCGSPAAALSCLTVGIFLHLVTVRMLSPQTEDCSFPFIAR